MKQAVAEGRLEGRLEIARKLKENGFSIADIVRIAGLRQKKLISCNGVYEFLYKAVLIREKDFFQNATAKNDNEW